MNEPSCSFTTNSDSHGDLDKNSNTNDCYFSQVSTLPQPGMNGSYCSDMLPQQLRKVGAKRKSYDLQVQKFDNVYKS